MKWRFDTFYSDEISSTYTPSYILAADSAAAAAFPSPGGNDLQKVSDLIGYPDAHTEHYEAKQCAMIMDKKNN